ncbi:MAG: hypothetical protein ACI9EF_002970, partial [Pseudohongiellaceae bacterium]
SPRRGLGAGGPPPGGGGAPDVSERGRGRDPLLLLGAAYQTIAGCETRWPRAILNPVLNPELGSTGHAVGPGCRAQGASGVVILDPAALEALRQIGYLKSAGPGAGAAHGVRAHSLNGVARGRVATAPGPLVSCCPFESCWCLAKPVRRPVTFRGGRRLSGMNIKTTATDEFPFDEDSEREAVQHWLDGSVERLLAVWALRGERYSRRLAEFDHPGDALDDLLTLAARRVVPLPAPRRRGLPREGLSPAVLALCQLARPDRQALRSALDGLDLDDPQRDHSAAAMWRLLERVRAARRRNDAPPSQNPGGDSEDRNRLS